MEYFNNIEEMEWAIELALTYNKPVAATMCMGPNGDGRVSFLASSGLVFKFTLENSSWRMCGKDGEGRSKNNWSQLSF